MQHLPVYQNLDTSFVNLSALIRYLRAQNFAGQIQLDLGGYKAEITFDCEKPIVVLEHDAVAGRIAEGDEALQRILIRAKNSGGTLNVVKFVESPNTALPEIKISNELPATKPISKPFSEKDLAAFAPAESSNGHGKFSPQFQNKRPPENFLKPAPEKDAPLPLEFTNRVENRARRTKITPADWHTLLNLIGELYGTIEEILKAANLDFSAMLTEARYEIADDYPFMNPSSGTFRYRRGTVEMPEQANAKVFAASINETLRRILERLADNANLLEVHRAVSQKILALAYRHRQLYDKFFITLQLEKILGV